MRPYRLALTTSNKAADLIVGAARRDFGEVTATIVRSPNGVLFWEISVDRDAFHAWIADLEHDTLGGHPL